MVHAHDVARMTGAVGAALIVSTLMACGARDGGGEASPEALGFRTEIGRVSAKEAAKELPKVLGSQGYQIVEERRTPGAFTVETHWRRRAPFPDEARRGIEAVETRLVVRGHEAMGSFSVDLEAESRVPGRDPAHRREVPTTEQFEAYAREIASKMRVALASGIRIK